MKFTLSEEDATRLGCPREIDFDLNRLMGRELLVLEKQTGWNYEVLQRNMQGKPLTNAIGQQLYELDADGNEIRDEAGNRVRVVGMDIETALIICWLAARRAKGSDIPWDDFDINIAATEFDAEPEGKAQKPASTTTRKATKGSTPTTSRRSRTTSASRRGTSTTG